MITLQRASAGSGKTFTLTKEYIGLLISIETDPYNPSKGRRLRTHGELADSVQHILGVTFTNKATNEMKERIISKLDELARYTPAAPKMPDYLKDFMSTYLAPDTTTSGRNARFATAAEISETCKEALEQLLYNYSDFNISTIDSFFQNILRTFAYESDLPDSYQVIIDDAHLASFASNMLIDDIAHGEADEDMRYWVGELHKSSLANGYSGWNFFNRKDNKYSVFRDISDMAASLERQENEKVRRALEDYRDSGLNLREQHIAINRQLSDRGAELFAPVIAAAEKVMETYGNESGGNPETLLPYGAATRKKLESILSEDADPLGDIRLNGKIKPTSYLPAKGITAARKRELEYLKGVWEEFFDAYTGWRGFVDGEEMRYWRLIEPALPTVALTANLSRRIQEYLTDNSAMKIADTNAMIHRIIGDDNDVPFIYERLGTRLNHFLIDEFQDTSRMQWENFRPLLAESLSHGSPNLIIGDAKQSIYRFRNAEPRLITDIVPATFRGQIIEKGDAPADNSNWRSRTNVVRFNNFFFRELAHKMAEVYGKGVENLYGNVVQVPRSKDEPESDPQSGYVEVNFYEAAEESQAGFSVSDQSDDGAYGNGRKIPGHLIKQIGTLITSLLNRGYRQKEIAVLVNSRTGGKEVISGLMNYNRHLKEGEQVLEFVSEDSLSLDSSAAVNTIIECFRLLQDNIENRSTQNNTGDKGEAGEDIRQSTAPAPVDWRSVQTNYIFFAARHPGLDLSTMLERFFAEGLSDTLIDDLVTGMQAVTLPSLVEAFAESFLTETQRRLEAPFIAALQDAVLDYCEANPTDIGSMLRWWDYRGKNISVSSPEDTDAISVMTIHKSKGLEFECVILPDLDLLLDMRKERIWLDVPQHLDYARSLPSMLPISLNPALAEGTVWQPIMEEERYQEAIDNLNKVYVAMTRAVSELYIFLPDPFKKGKSSSVDTPDLESRYKNNVRSYAYTICRDADEELSDNPDTTTLPQAGDIVQSDDFRRFTYGKELDAACLEAALAESRKKGDNGTISEPINEYYVNSDRYLLKFHPEWEPHLPEEADDDRVDPLSEGSEKHAILEYVKVEEDLPYALERMRGRGLLTRKKIRRYLPELQAALESVRDRGWFDGSWQVFNERPMLAKGEVLRRPDRVMVSPEGDAIVVDYKFSTSDNFAEKVKAHRRQVGEYMGWLEAMNRFRSVKGYLWYVNRDEIIEVEHSVSFEAQKKARKEARRKEKELKELREEVTGDTAKR